MKVDVNNLPALFFAGCAQMWRAASLVFPPDDLKRSPSPFNAPRRENGRNSGNIGVVKRMANIL